MSDQPMITTAHQPTFLATTFSLVIVALLLNFYCLWQQSSLIGATAAFEVWDKKWKDNQLVLAEHQEKIEANLVSASASIARMEKEIEALKAAAAAPSAPTGSPAP